MAGGDGSAWGSWHLLAPGGKGRSVSHSRFCFSTFSHFWSLCGLVVPFPYEMTPYLSILFFP